MKNYIRILIMIIALAFGAVSGAWAQLTNDDIEIDIKPSDAAGTITKSVNSREVTLTVTPTSGYFIRTSDFIVEKLVSPGNANARRRVGEITDVIKGKMYTNDMSKEITSVEAGSSAKYIFTIPDGYDGVYVTATFHLLTEDDVIRITASTSLGDTPDMTKHYVLVEDVSATVVEKLYSNTAFTGIFEGEPQEDGNFPKISGLSHALFKTITGGTVKNIALESVGINITTKDTNVGAIANEASGASRIYNCGILSGSVSGTKYVGGIVGQISGTTRVINCYSYADITSGSSKAGIVGHNRETSKQGALTTMVMNCMFYGNITGEGNIYPIYGGTRIENSNAKAGATNTGLATYNYYLYDSEYSVQSKINNARYGCALAVEKKFLNQCELYRHLLNSNKKLAAWYVTGNADDADKVAKWVFEAADRTISNPMPYPILKAQGYYPSIINYDAEHAPDSASVGRLNGGKVGRPIAVTISGVGDNAPSGASLNRTYLTLIRTDKDIMRHNFNYDKVQLPYYNDVGEGNYTKNRVVTGWKITSVTGGTPGTFKEADEWGGYNFADRKCTNKDLNSVSGRVFSQGAYYDVPYGVTAITIEPYWANAAYVSDQYYDVVYGQDYAADNVEDMGVQRDNNTLMSINGDEQTVYTSIENARAALEIDGSKRVYDYAVVLVGNVHQSADDGLSYENTPYTIMSVDLDKDNEPDHSFIFSHNGRKGVSPIRFDFLNVIGTAQAQKPHSVSTLRNVSIVNPTGWFEVTNTCLIYFVQFECDNSNNSSYPNSNKSPAPVIFLGGVVDQFTSTQKSATANIKNTTYIHVGSNAWFKSLSYGTHSDGSGASEHIPISVTGGDFEGLYLSGTYRPSVSAISNSHAECYISGGRITEAAGAGQEQIKGNVQWQIYNADIENFYGGGINADKPITGNIIVDVINSNINTYCGGPKFGNMSNNKTVETRAVGTTFGKYFGAGNGGTSYSRVKYYDKSKTQGMDFPGWEKDFIGENGDRGKYFNGTTPAPTSSYGKKGVGVAIDFDYEFFVWSSGVTGGRYYVKFATFSLAKTNNVTSTLTNCVITGDFYGGGNLAKVDGTATSILNSCEVKGSVYGGGFSATLPIIKVRNGGFDSKYPTVNSYSGMLEPGTWTGTTDYEWKQVDNLPDDGGDGMESTTNGNYVYTDQNLTTLGQVKNSNLTIMGTTTVAGDVYGGGALASMDTSGTAVVNLIGGTINGNVYGGGQGRLPGGKDANNHDLPEVAALVGSASVNLNGLDYTSDKTTQTQYTSWGLIKDETATGTPYVVKDDAKGCVVKGSIFGCNNLNGTPKGTATVHIYKTQNADASRITNPIEGEKTAKVKGRYDVAAVYGGGNLAAYIPSNENLPTAAATVIIDGCDRTSIQTVYGGGNAASTPATRVTVNGTYEIGELFGGGNGKDDIVINNETKPNPGANVGYKDYSEYYKDGDVWKVRDKADADTKEERLASDYVYGSGQASVNIFGGTVHSVFGGSNTKGNVRKTAVTMLDDNSGCDFCVDEAYGGGKHASMDAEAQLLMACIPGLKAVYGGAEAADLHDNVTLNITNGTFERVFGGNNISGTIRGSITVNIEETGCKPIIIGELYGGGNQAGYSVYGYDSDDKPIEEGTTPIYNDPQVNVKSFTSIGNIYGGGYGSGATMVGNPTVNVNEVVGTTNYPSSGDFDATGYKGKTITLDEGEETEHTVQLPSHTKGKIGAINNVFGGGNAARVIGNTNVNIGTLSTIDYVTKGTGEALPRTNIDVVGVDIRGNVYGGGNNAEVTGNTNVVIGKKAE